MCLSRRHGIKQGLSMAIRSNTDLASKTSTRAAKCLTIASALSEFPS